MSASDTYILFELAGAAFGVRSRDVLHVDLLEHITPVPNAAPWVDGVVFSRGQVIPAMNLRCRFGFPREEPTPRTRLIFVKTGERIVALIVDSAREFRTIADTAIRPIEDTLTGIQGNYIKAVATIAGRLVLLIDVAAVMSLESAEPEPTTPLPATTVSLQPAV